MSMRLGLTTVAVAMVIASCTKGTTSTSAPSSTTPTGAGTGAVPALTAFKSPRLGYQIAYPSDWTVVAATRPWLFGQSGGEPYDTPSTCSSLPGPPSSA